MATREWFYIMNTFEVQTRRNFKKMLTLDLDHYGNLVEAADLQPAIIPLRDDYLPLHTSYQNIYALWQGAEGTHEGSTIAVKTLMENLNTDLRVWEGVVRFVFPEDSADERSIFPDKRRPFQKGTYEQRISAIRTLYLKLATYTGEALLVTLSATVQSFYNNIEAARLAQTGDEMGITAQRDLLEEQRVLCARGMYGNLGRLMYIMRENPVNIESFWDLSLLRNSSEPPYTEDITADPHSDTEVGLSADQRGKVEANSVVLLRNTTEANVPLSVGFSTAPGVSPSLLVVVLHGAEIELNASELGWSSEKKYLLVQNGSDETGTLHLEIDF